MPKQLADGLAHLLGSPVVTEEHTHPTHILSLDSRVCYLLLGKKPRVSLGDMEFKWAGAFLEGQDSLCVPWIGECGEGGWGDSVMGLAEGQPNVIGKCPVQLCLSKSGTAWSTPERNILEPCS